MIPRSVEGRRQASGPAVILGGVLGMTLGAWAGAVDTRRVEGGAIGYGAGALGGLLYQALLAGDDPGGPPANRRSGRRLLRAAMIGAAFGGVLGGLIGGTSRGDPLAAQTVQLRIAF